MFFHRVITYGKPFRAIFFRRTNPELEDAIDQFTELFGVHATWIASKNAFEFWKSSSVRAAELIGLRREVTPASVSAQRPVPSDARPDAN